MPPSHTHSIAVITKGKQCVLEAGALPKLVSLLSDENSEVRLNSIKVSSDYDVIQGALIRVCNQAGAIKGELCLLTETSRVMASTGTDVSSLSHNPG